MNVSALTNPSETCLGFDDRHNIWCKLQIHLKIESQVCKLIHNERYDIDSVSIHDMRDDIPVETSNLVLISTLKHKGDSCNFVYDSRMMPKTLSAPEHSSNLDISMLIIDRIISLR